MERTDRRRRARPAPSGTGPVFAQEGALVTALKEGRWILFDKSTPPRGDARAPERRAGERRRLGRARRAPATRLHATTRFRARRHEPATDAGTRPAPCAETGSRRCTRASAAGRPLPARGERHARCPRRARRRGGGLTSPFAQGDSSIERRSRSIAAHARARGYVRHAAPVYGTQRVLYDGFAMSFQTLLKRESAEELERLGGASDVSAALRCYYTLTLFFSRKHRFSFSFQCALVTPSSPRGPLRGLVAVPIGVVEPPCTQYLFRATH